MLRSNFWHILYTQAYDKAFLAEKNMKKSNKRSLEYRKIILYSQLRERDKNSCGNLNL